MHYQESVSQVPVIHLKSDGKGHWENTVHKAKKESAGNESKLKNVLLGKAAVWIQLSRNPTMLSVLLEEWACWWQSLQIISGYTFTH